MTTILHVASSSNLQSSVTRAIGTITVTDLAKKYPAASIIQRDLVTEPLPHVSPEFVGALKTGGAPLALSDKLIEEVLRSDVLVIEVPMYNFGIPSALKAWIDHVIRAGKTFTYGETGPVGLATGKKAYLVVGRGGIYSDGPMKAFEHQESYLRSVLGFIGITEIESIIVEGVAYGPEKAAEALKTATARAHDLIAA